MSAQEICHRLDTAIALAEAGQRDEAEALLRALVAEGARLPKAAMALGVLCGERGDRAERRLWLQQARRLEEASGEPLSLRLLLNQLVDALEQGDPQQALAYGEEALALYPADGEVHLQVARVYSVLEKPDDAHRHLELATAGLRARLAIQPEDVKAWRLLAMAEQSAERLDGAIEALGGALELDPNHLPSLLAISRLLIGRGQTDEALPWLMNALAVAPDDPEVIVLNGSALTLIGEPFQAMDLFRQALKISPGNPEPFLKLGSCLCELGLFGEAEQVFRESLESNPGDIECRSGLAAALRDQGNAAGAVAIYKELLEQVPDAQGAFNNLMFTYSISSVAPPDEVLATARAFWGRQGVANTTPRSKRTRSQGRPIKVGLLSADIGSHVVGRFLDPVLRHHDPSQCQLELISMQRRYEASSEALIKLADGFHSLEGIPRDQARDLLRQQEYDLIIDTSGYTRGTGLHLLAERCAPVQAHYIGYHATTGLSTIDWFIGDEETAAADLQPQFSERLYRLPRPWLAYPSDPPFPQAEPLMQTDRPVLGSFCQVSKISSTTLAIWSQLLQYIPEALLVLKDRGLQDPTVRERLEQALVNAGIDRDRIRFMAPVSTWHDHVDHYNIMDIALDTTPWSSATTAFEALAMGVPLLAIRGECMAARMSSSLIKGLGEEWTISNEQSLTQKTKKILKNLYNVVENRKLKQERQHRAIFSNLFDGKDLSDKLVDCFREISL
jgi:protein O-GlcNAc transferase